MSIFWAAHTRDEIGLKILSGWKTAILPMGAIEQHGKHLTVNYDILIAERIATDLAKKGKIFVLPGLQYGMSSHHLGFHGTISLSASTMISTLIDISISLQQSGIQKLVLINGHGGNYSLILEFSEKFADTNFKIIHDAKEKFLFKTISKLSNQHTSADLGLHGGKFETSLALYTHPDAVRLDHMQPGELPPVTGWTEDLIRQILKSGLATSAPSGIIGDPTYSKSEYGEYFYKILLSYYEQHYEATC